MAPQPLLEAIAFALPWPPSANEYWRSTAQSGRVVVYVSAEAKAYRTRVAIALQMLKVRRGAYGGSLALFILAHPPDHIRRDVDNLFKQVLDSLEAAGVLADDCYIDHLSIERSHVKEGGALAVELSPWKGAA